MRLTLTTVNIGAPDPVALARFYEQLLGWDIAVEEKHWVLLVQDLAGGVRLSFQHEPYYRPPVWPAGPNDQQMMMHLEIRVDDLAVLLDPELPDMIAAAGATLIDFAPLRALQRAG